MITFSKETGISLIIIGFMFTLAGIFMFADRAIIIVANLLTIVGFLGLFGGQPQFFFETNKRFGSLFFFLGVFLVIVKYLSLGVLMQTIGIFLLFKSIIPSFNTIISRILQKVYFEKRK